MPNAPALTVPSTHEELLDPAWLHEAIDEIGPDDVIVSVERTGTSKTRAEKLQFAVTFDGPTGRRVGQYCAKAYLDGSNPGSITETLFYRDLAPRLDLRVPRVHYTGIEDGAAIIVMEDVVAHGGVFSSPHHPLSPATVRETLSLLANLHGSTWGLESVADLDWLGAGVSASRMYGAEKLQELLDDGRAEGFPEEIRSGANLAAALAEHDKLGITCVLHGDTHTGNTYLDGEGRGCWFDWETISVGHWAQDVSYHLAASLSIEDRRAHEQDLLRHYLSELSANGGPTIPFDEAWDLYRKALSHGYLFWVITMIRGRDEVLAHMPRIGAALDDHQTYKLLGVI